MGTGHFMASWTMKKQARRLGKTLWRPLSLRGWMWMLRAMLQALGLRRRRHLCWMSCSACLCMALQALLQMQTKQVLGPHAPYLTA